MGGRSLSFCAMGWKVAKRFIMMRGCFAILSLATPEKFQIYIDLRDFGFCIDLVVIDNAIEGFFKLLELIIGNDEA